MILYAIKFNYVKMYKNKIACVSNIDVNVTCNKKVELKGIIQKQLLMR